MGGGWEDGKVDREVDVEGEGKGRGCGEEKEVKRKEMGRW